MPGDAAAPRLVNSFWALVTLVVAAGIVAWLVRS